MESKNVSVVGLSELGATLLRPVAETRGWNVAAMATDANGARPDANGARPDAMVAFDGSTASHALVALRERFGLLGPSMSAVMRCAHPYWNRLTQASAIPGHQPVFQPFDPYDADSIHAVAIEPPLWIRPMCSASFSLRVEARHDLAPALSAIRRVIGGTAESFERSLRCVETPRSIEDLGSRSCIAESFLHGQPTALEGYVQGGQVRTLGVIDGGLAACEYSYPSVVPHAIQLQMERLCRTMVGAIGLEHGCFHADFVWNGASNRLWVQDFQPRVFSEYAPLFAAVDGTSNVEVAIDVALGNAPRFQHGDGSHSVAVVRLPRTPAGGEGSGDNQLRGVNYSA